MVAGSLGGALVGAGLVLGILPVLPGTVEGALPEPGLRLGLLSALVVAGLAAAGAGLWSAQAFDHPQGAAADRRLLRARMSAALARLKRDGGHGFPLGRPWYVVIGPPGAGKTTALRGAGLPAPEQDRLTDGAPDGHGTGSVEWWVTPSSVLLDTPGRYMAQAVARGEDAAGWTALLRLLRRRRPRPPLNGVLLAIPVDALLRGTAEGLAHDAARLRDRLDEMVGALDTDLPVYVLFTKVDLVAGFREAFGGLGPQARRGVWGCTFQTDRPDEATAPWVGPEFDALLARLGPATVDGIAGEPDGRIRMAGFAFPTRMAALKPQVERFLGDVFGATVSDRRSGRRGRRRGRRAFLRGFYFTAATPEAASPGGAAPGAAYASDMGGSFFLHDLLTRVIVAEHDWTAAGGPAATGRQALARLALGAVVVATVAAMAAVVASYWRSATMVTRAEAAAAAYFETAATHLGESVLSDPDPGPVLTPLAALRALPGAVPGSPLPDTGPGLGLGRDAEIAAAARRAYSDGLERLLRPRMMLALETDLAAALRADDVGAVFRLLRVALSLAQEPAAAGGGDEAVIRHFERRWRAGLPPEEVAALREHLAALLAPDGDRTDTMAPSPRLVARARDALAALPSAELVLAVLETRAAAAGVADVVPVELIPGAGELLRTTDGRDLAALHVAGLYTEAGAAAVLPEGAGEAAEAWRAARRLMSGGDVPEAPRSAPAGLDDDVAVAYRHASARAWARLVDGLALRAITPDAAGAARLQRLGNPDTSPLPALAKMAARAPEGAAAARELAAVEAAVVADLTHAFAALGRAVAQDAPLDAGLAALSAAGANAPEPLARMAAAAAAQLRQPDPDAALAETQAALDALRAGPCAAALDGFPIAPPASAGVPIAAFADLLGPGGYLNRFVERHLHGHVIETPAGLVPDRGDAVGARLDPDALARLDALRRVQQAFFDGSAAPEVTAAIALTEEPPDVALVRLTIEGATLELMPDGPAGALRWRGTAPGVTVEIFGAAGERLGRIAVARDGWDLARWLDRTRTGSPAGPRIDLRAEVDGRRIGFRFDVAGDTVPFTMPDLRGLRCPATLE